MLKKLLIFLILLGLLVVGAAAYVVINANSFIAQFQPIAEEKASAFLGTPVKLGTIGTGFFPNVHLTVDKFSVGAVADSPGVTLNNLTLDIGLKALLEKKLQINKLSLSSPAITFVRDSSGVYIEGLPRKATKNSPPPTHSPSAPSAGTQLPSTTTSPIRIDLDSFEIQQARVVLDDKVLGKRFEIAPINLAVAVKVEGSVARIVSLKLDGKALDLIPFSAKAQDITLDQETGKAKIPELVFGLFGSQHAFGGEFDLRSLKANFSLANRKALEITEILAVTKLLPAETQKLVQQFGLTGSIEPSLKGNLTLPNDIQVSGITNLRGISAKVANFSAAELGGSLASNIELPKQTLSSEKLSLQLNGQPIELSFKAQMEQFKELKLNSANIAAFGGTIHATADAQLTPTKPYHAEARISNLQIGSALTTVSPNAGKLIEGTLSSLEVRANGTVTENPQLAVEAQGNANIVKAKLVGINIVGLVLKSVDSLPFLKKNLYESIPESERGPIDAPDTEVDSIVAQYSLKNGVLNLSSLSMCGPLFRMEASGKASLGLEVDLNATITLSNVVTGILITAAKDFSKIVDARGQLTFPLTIKGTLPKIMVYPDLTKVAAIAAERVLKEQAGKALDKALDRATGGKMKGLGGLLGF